MTDGPRTGLEVQKIKQEETFLLGPVVRLGNSIGKAPACRAGDPGLNPDPGDNVLS